MPQLLLGDLDLLSDPYMATVGSSWGEWVAITTTTDSLFLDGSVVSGEQSGNRAISLQVLVQSDVRPSMTRACEALFAEANKQANTLTFVPDDGVTVVYDVFRAQPERTDDESEAWGYRTYTFTFPAMPFARSATRTSTKALSPSITLADFESATTGVLLATGNRTEPGPGSEFGMPYDTTLAESSWVQVARPPSLTADTACTVTNSTTVQTPRSTTTACSKVTATAAGLLEAHVTAAGGTSAAAVTAGVNVYWTGGTKYAQAGIEWLDAASNVLSVEWSAPQLMRNGGQVFSGSAAWEGGTVWASGTRPTSATQARLRFRVPGALSGEVYPILGAAIIPLTSGTIATSTAVSHDGSKSVSLVVTSMDPKSTQSGFVHPSNPQGSGFLKVALAAPVNISAKPLLQSWVYSGAIPVRSYDVMSMRLSDAAAKWSRYDAFTVGPVGADGWQNITWNLASPSQVSSAGAVDLTAVTSASLSAVREWNGGAIFVDGIQAVDQPTATNSPRGTVYELDIIGSARSPVQVEILSPTVAMTDFLVASVFAGSENPMLRVTSSVATAPAPAVYDGVYSIIGAVAPATALASPTCVVAQLINGAQVATTTLTGTQLTGNHYVDFGQVSLPLVAVPDENAGVSYTFTSSPSSAAWSEVLVLGADAPLVWVPNLPTAQPYAWVDEPALPAQVGRVWVGSAPDRSDARAPSSPPVQSRPFQVAAPSTRTLVFATSGAPSIIESYFGHWLVEPDA